MKLNNELPTTALQLFFFLILTTGAATTWAQASGGGAFFGVRMDATPSGQVRLTSVLPGSPAARSGLRSGDLLVEVDGRSVSTPDEVVSRIRASQVGARLRAGVLRFGQQQVFTVTLGPAPAQGQLHRAFIGEPAPTLRLPPVGGNGPVDLSTLTGRVVVLYFWSVWCGACRAATPELNRLEQSLGSQGLTVLAISHDGLDELRQSPSVGQLAMPLLHDLDAKVSGDYWISAVPTIFVVDQRGRIAFAGEGWDPSQGRAVETEVRRLLNGRRP